LPVFRLKPPKKFLEPTGISIGCDVGLTTFATLSDGIEIDNPRFLKTDEKILAIAQRRLSNQLKGSKQRYKKRKNVAKIHSRIKNRRSNFAHQVSNFLVKNYDQIFFESLNIKGMVKNHCLSKAISDVAWNQLISFSLYKAENAGKICKTINPNHTSQDCSNCGYRQKMPLELRIYECSNCNISIGRDLNASLNILSVGLDTLRNQSVEIPSKQPSLAVEVITDTKFVRRAILC